MADEVFRAKAPRIMRDIMRDLGAHLHGACAAVGNFGHETGGLTLRLEKGKTSYDTTGFGWAQWTGSRRRDFDTFARANGFSDVAANPGGCPEDRYDAACYAFFIHEITNTWEKRALPNLRMAWSQTGRSAEQDIAERTITFMREYERPGVPHEQRRISMARIALEAFNSSGAPMPDTKPPVASIVPAEWMPSAKMQRIIVHWTAGQHRASADDRTHYHMLVEGDGKLIQGTKSIKGNEAPIKGDYTAHTLNCNSGSIGVSVCAMMGAIESPFNPGPAPITRMQWDALIKVLAALATNYNIAVTPKTILSHAEVQTNLGIQQRGKWDIARLPFDPTVVGAKAVGDKMRAEVRAAMGVTQPGIKTEVAVGTGGAIVIGGGAAVARDNDIGWGPIIAVSVMFIAAVLIVIFMIRRKKQRG